MDALVVRRRDVLALPLVTPWSVAAAASVPIHYRNPPPYQPFARFIESGHDEFPADPPMPPSPAPPSPRGRFADITGAVLDSDQLSKGIPYWMARLDPATGIDIYGNQGIAAGDMDGDGRDEIYVCQPAGLPNKLFRWDGARLADISAAAGVDLLDDSSCALFLDLRNIGRQDLVVLRGAGPVLYLNNGDGRFTLLPDVFRFASLPQGGFTGMAAADYDRDGRVDLYLCCYSFFQSEAQFRYPVPYFDARNGPGNFLFQNQLRPDGTGHFEDVTAAVGLNENNDRYSFAPAWADYDGSGYPSLYVANDFGRNNLYKNEGGRFRDVAAEAGVEDIGPGMSACWFDANGDGRPDLYVANMWTAVGQQLVRHKAFAENTNPAWHGHTKGNSFYRNLGNGRFASEAASAGIEMGRWGWSADAADFDNDGRAELLLTCGMLTGHKQPDLMGFFWRQVVSRTPADASPRAPYEEGWNAINQFIREGYSWNGREPNVYYVRDGAKYRDASAESGLNFADDSRAFALTDLTGDGCLDVLLKNRLAPQLRVLRNQCGQGNERIALRLIGTKSNRDAVGACVSMDGQTKWVTAGSGYLSQHTKTLHFGLGARKVAAAVRVKWPSGLEQEFADLAAGRLYSLTEGRAPREARVFAAARAIVPRPVRADNVPRLHDTWLHDAVPLPERRTGPGLHVITARSLAGDADLVAAYSLFRRYLFEFRAPLELPLAMLLNSQGHAAKVYASVPSAAQVAADVKQLGARPALPYPGRALNQPRRDYFKLGASLVWCGYPEHALPYLEAVLARQPGNVRALVLTAQVHREANRLDRAGSLLDDALRLDPQSAEAWNELGGIAMARQDYAAALENFEQALAAKSGLVYALLNAGQAADKLGRLPRAEELYRAAMVADSRSAEAAQGLGLTLAKRGDVRQAETHLLAAVKLRPAFASAWNNLGVLYLQARATEKAIGAFRSGIQAVPGDELLYLNLGRLYVQEKRVAEARRTMEDLLKVHPESRVARQALADLDKTP